MAAPTLSSYTETVWNTATAPKTTASISVTSGDVLVVAASTEDSNTTLATPTNSGTGLTWTLQQSIVVSNYCAVYMWTAVASSTTSLTVTVTKTGFGTGWYGFGVYAFSGSDGVGVSAKQNNGSPPSLSTGTLTSANSALVSISADWSPVDATSRTWRTVESITPTSGNGYEKSYFRDAGHYTTTTAYWPDAGTGTTAETVGLSAPASGWAQGTIVVEVRGAGSTNGSVTTTAPTAAFSVPTPGAAAQFDGATTTTAPSAAFSVPTPGAAAQNDGATTTTAPATAFSVPTPGAAAQFNGSTTTAAPAVAFSVPTPGAVAADGSTNGSTTTTAPAVAFSVPTPGVSAGGETTTMAPSAAFSVPTPGVSVSATVQAVAASVAFSLPTPGVTGDTATGIPYIRGMSVGMVTVSTASPHPYLEVEVS